MKKHNLLFLALMLTISLRAQYVVPLTATPQGNVRIPWSLENLSIVDNQLFGYSEGVLLSSPISNDHIHSLQPDTTLAPLVPNANYVIRNPRDSMLYFTRHDEDGITRLYSYHKQRFKKIHRIDIRGWHRDICHPTFSPSGNLMIFTSRGKVGLGGYDLWCSLWNGHQWSRPINMGNAINTAGNEIDPVFYRNHLIFASDSIQKQQSGYHLYAVSVRDASNIDDIIFDSYVIQPIPDPINGIGNDMNIAFDKSSDQGFWISTRTGKKELYHFKGLIDGVTVSGTITDNLHRPIAQAEITLSIQDRIAASTLSDNEGHYSLFVLPNNYLLQIAKKNHFNFTKELSVTQNDHRTLISSLTQNATLSSLPTNRQIMLQHVFNQSADIELSSQAHSELQPIINFLRDNPNVTAEFSVYCDYSDDETFNNALIEHRINNLYKYLSSYIPQRRQISIKNGNEMEEIESSESGANFIFLILKTDLNN